MSCGNCAVMPPPPPATVPQSPAPKLAPTPACALGRYCVLEYSFQGDVDEETVGLARDFLANAAPLAPAYVVFRIDTHGGEIDEGFHLARMLEDVPYPVVCLVDNEALSMGFFILQSCDTRLITPRGRLMAHEARYEKLEHVTGTDLQKLQGSLRTDDERLVQQVTRRLRVKSDEYRDLVRAKDWYMTAEDALRVGAVDGIWPHDGKTLVRRLAEFGTY
jgi:ATP-dependent protease ClpP protease subunit